MDTGNSFYKQFLNSHRSSGVRHAGLVDPDKQDNLAESHPATQNVVIDVGKTSPSSVAL